MLELLEKKRPILSAKEQINHLKSKSVKFNLCSEESAIQYLEKNNNYFKLRAYRKNYEKYIGGSKNGQYINLDFAMLKDLAIIDMKLRYVLLLMALDIEHFEKVKLLKYITESKNDGYSIVNDYIEFLKNIENYTLANRKPYTSLNNEINRNKSGSYCSGIVLKYDGNYPVWAFVELISFGSFIHFVGFCADYFHDKKFKDDYFLMLSVKSLRNAAAHSNCIINDLSLNNTKHKPNYNVLRELSKIGISKTIHNKRMSNSSIQDIITLLYTHKTIVTSDGVHTSQGKALHEIIKRCYRNIEYYKDNELITATFDFLKKVIDNFFKI